MRILKEDAIGIIPETETAVVVETEPRGPESAEEIASSSMLLNAISDCAKTIEQYNIMKVNLTDPEMISVIDEISSEETLILGKLQSLLKKVSPNAENIMNGAVETEQQLGESFLTERKWNTTITAGKALRQAINNEDYQGILDGIKACYKEMLDKGIIDESDYDNWTENLDSIEIEDEDIEDAIDYELNDLYDACDNLNCWIELNESLKESTDSEYETLCKLSNGLEVIRYPYGYAISDGYLNDRLVAYKNGFRVDDGRFKLTDKDKEKINRLIQKGIIKKFEESLKESKDDLETKVYDFLDNEAEVSDYNQMVEDVSAKFHISRKKAEQFVWNYLSAEEEAISNPM